MGKRRVRPSTQPAAAVDRAPLRPAPALAIAALVVALVIAGGVGLDQVARVRPSAGFAACHPQQELAPRYYKGAPAMCIDPKRTYDGTMVTTKGNIGFVFLTAAAPKTVNNFIVLAENGYYDGLSFFRAESWVVQGGDPQGDGRGGPGYSLPPELPSTPDKWVPGSMGMARFPDGSISGSQFFILRGAWPGGDPTVPYNHFATITTGYDIAGQLGTSDRVLTVRIKAA